LNAAGAGPVRTVTDAGAFDDRALLERIEDGDSNALRVLYDRHGGHVLAIARRVLGGRSEAEEIVQETFVQVWRRASDYNPTRGGVAAWVMTIARSRAIDRLRALGAADRAAIRAAADDAPQAPLPAELAERRQLREQVGAALRKLPEEQRAAIELAYFEGLSQSEIATRIGDPLGTVKTRVRLGMRKLAALLSHLEPEVST
jgi:RNA polymerase sigma-70 factor (ECF subfamily)